jgi:hypothetical protein
MGSSYHTLNTNYPRTGLRRVYPHKYQRLFPAFAAVVHSIVGTGGVVCAGHAIGDMKIVHPMSDISTGSWSVAPLYDKIDEIIPSDIDYICSSIDPSNDACEVLLESGIDPLTGIDHVLSYRYCRSGIIGQLDLTVQVVEGTTIIATWTHTNVDIGWLDAEQELSEAQANSITNYSNLRIRFTANKV